MDILIIWGVGIAFLIIIAIVNKIRGAVDTGKKPYHYKSDIERKWFYLAGIVIIMKTIFNRVFSYFSKSIG